MVVVHLRSRVPSLCSRPLLASKPSYRCTRFGADAPNRRELHKSPFRQLPTRLDVLVCTRDRNPFRAKLRRTVLRRVLAQAQIQRVLDEARRHHIIGSTHVSCKAAAILRCASNAGRAHLYYLHKSSSKCNQTSTSRGRTSQSCTTRKPKYYYYYYYYYYSPFSLNLSQTKKHWKCQIWD